MSSMAILMMCLLAMTVSEAFRPARARTSAVVRPRTLQMRVAGESAPFGYFDPLGLSPSDPKEFQRYQEAELKHGRVSMLAIVGLAVGENTSLFFGGDISGPGIYQFQMADAQIPFFWAFVLFNIALIEGTTISKGWESPQETRDRGATFAGLKDSYIPGDLGFDPLNFTPRSPSDFAIMRTKELNNGRLAMIAVAGVVAQELVTGAAVLHRGP